MDESELLRRLLHFTTGIRDKHDYRRDIAFDGRRLARLPDRTLIAADEYEQRCAKYERARWVRQPDGNGSDG